MSDDAIEKRLSSLSEEVTRLQATCASLHTRLSALEALPPVVRPSDDEEQYVTLPDIDSEKIWDKMAASSFLPRIAAICFILVFALILRTLTDNDIINTKVGSVIGIGYAAFLIAWGVRLLNRQSKLAAVFQVCGVVLMYTITLETHARFASFSASAVYAILFALVVAVSLISLRCRFSGLNILGIFGTCVVASAIDFPEPNFAHLGLLLFTGNVLAYISAKKLGKGEWNRFLVYLLTMGVWILWSFRLQAEINLVDQPTPDFVSESWFYPLLVSFALAFMAMPMVTAWKKQQLSVFDLLLPTFTVLWTYPLAAMILHTTAPHSLAASGPGVLWAAGHFAFAAYLLRQREIQVPAVCTFSVAGGMLLSALPEVVGGVLFAVPIWSALALLLARIAQKYQMGGLRVIAYFLQAGSCLLAIGSGSFAPSAPLPFIVMLIAATLTILSMIHYNWSRRQPLAANSGFFVRSIDRRDRSAVILLIAALISGFATLQVAAYQMLLFLAAEPAVALIGIQSLLINSGTIGLLIFAKHKANKELLTIAVLITIIGGFKVFCYDLFTSAGVPVVLSVLSFGVVAATASVVLGRWSSSRPAGARSGHEPG